MILEEMRSCLLKLELSFWTYSLIRVLTKAFGPNCPKLVLRPQTPNITALRFKKFFISSFIKFFMQQALIFKFYVTFDKVMSVFSQKMVKKPIKILLFGAIPDMQVSPKPCLKIPPFLAR